MLAGSGQDMQRDYDYTSTVFGADLESSAAIGRRTGERAARRPPGGRQPDGACRLRSPGLAQHRRPSGDCGIRLLGRTGTNYTRTAWTRRS